jgi:hypothetical protein
MSDVPGETCPRCGGTEFRQLDCGPDSYEDDRFWFSYQCRACELWWDGWEDKWLVDCKTWLEACTARVYDPEDDWPPDEAGG